MRRSSRRGGRSTARRRHPGSARRGSRHSRITPPLRRRTTALRGREGRCTRLGSTPSPTSPTMSSTLRASGASPSARRPSRPRVQRPGASRDTLVPCRTCLTGCRAAPSPRSRTREAVVLVGASQLQVPWKE